MSTADTPIPKPDYWEAAVAHLMRRDRILKKIIPQHPDAWLTSRGTPFVTLARAIIGQQVSTKAADAVWDKFIEAAGSAPRRWRCCASASTACGRPACRSARPNTCWTWPPISASAACIPSVGGHG